MVDHDDERNVIEEDANRATMRDEGIPPVSDYAHWGEDAERVWYDENKYDMFYGDDPYDDYDYYEGE